MVIQLTVALGSWSLSSSAVVDPQSAADSGVLRQSLAGTLQQAAQVFQGRFQSHPFTFGHIAMAIDIAERSQGHTE
jgi:hypothetical protein